MNKQAVICSLVILAACGGNGENLFSGTIEIDQVRVSARVGGFVESVLVNRGDSVAFGQLLVVLDDTPFQLAVAGSEAGLLAAEASLATLLQGTRQQQIISAGAAVEEARALSFQKRSDLERARELSLAGALSEQDLQAAETASVQADARLSTAVQAYSLAMEGARTTEIEMAEASVEAARVMLDINLQQLEWASVTAPLSGSVTGISILAGENAAAGMTLLTVASMDTVKVVFYIPETLLSRVNTGDQVIVSSDSGESAAGRVVFIADEAEFTPSTVETRDGRTSLVYRVEAEITNADGCLKGGMPVDVSLENL